MHMVEFTQYSSGKRLRINPAQVAYVREGSGPGGERTLIGFSGRDEGVGVRETYDEVVRSLNEQLNP